MSISFIEEILLKKISTYTIVAWSVKEKYGDSKNGHLKKFYY